MGLACSLGAGCYSLLAPFPKRTHGWHRGGQSPGDKVLGYHSSFPLQPTSSEAR